MGFWSSCIFLLHLIATVKLLHPDEVADLQRQRDKLREIFIQELEKKETSDSGRMLLCACSTSDCREKNRTTCYGIKCFTQYHKKKDGSDPIERGCVVGNTPILCENPRPILGPKRQSWLYLECCDNEDLCNSQTMVTPHPSYNRSKSNRHNHSTESRIESEGVTISPPPISTESSSLSTEDHKIRFPPRRRTKVASPESGAITGIESEGVTRSPPHISAESSSLSGEVDKTRFSPRRRTKTPETETITEAAIIGLSRGPPPISAESPFLTEDDGKIHFPPTRKVKVAGPDPDKTTAKTPSGIEDFLHPGLLQAFRAFSPGSHRYNWPICKPVVLAVLVVGMFLLISILGYGFYILRSQSNYLQRFMQGYMRSPDEEETLNPVRATANTQIQIPLIVNKIDKIPISNL